MGPRPFLSTKEVDNTSGQAVLMRKISQVAALHWATIDCVSGAWGEGSVFLAISTKRSDGGLHLGVNLQGEVASPGHISAPLR